MRKTRTVSKFLLALKAEICYPKTVPGVGWGLRLTGSWLQLFQSLMAHLGDLAIVESDSASDSHAAPLQSVDSTRKWKRGSSESHSETHWQWVWIEVLRQWLRQADTGWASSSPFLPNQQMKWVRGFMTTTTYHWRELPQFLSQQTRLLLRQKYACRDKSFVGTKAFVTTSVTQ